ncbi:MAG TPA: 23S rRNA (adenine(1618)-N(6))-methyltransferase RlmF [Rhodocyclaceae bacterium]|nr:23S rRNA (adenine(1618)-N(6))-methyltransferase RlmF [Rhodocyclaceae bacterium]
MSNIARFHPRNRHQGRYDFDLLLAAYPALQAFVRANAYADESIDFADPQAVRALNAALLALHYGIKDWNIPPQYLCPPIPSRADYVHHLADLLAGDKKGNVPTGSSVRLLDIGTGANCIYPLIAQCEYGWQVVGSDIDAGALASAQAILAANGIPAAQIELRLQSERNAIFKGVVKSGERFHLTLCNPPFHASMAEAQAGTRRKVGNLEKVAQAAPLKRKDKGAEAVALNFGGQANELVCPGGEEGFILRMIEESARIPQQCLWFTSLVSKAATLPALSRALHRVGVAQSQLIKMKHGQKESRVLAWTFLNKQQQGERLRP